MLWFFTWAAIYVAILLFLDLSKFFITEAAISAIMGFGHLLAGTSNFFICLNMLWLHFTLRGFLFDFWPFLLILLVPFSVIEYYWKKRKERLVAIDR
jgi:hypothetical protein